MVITLLLLLAIAKIPIHNPDSRLQAASDNKQTIIILPAEEYKFASGKAELPLNLKNNLRQNGQDGLILKAIKKEIEKAQQKVDIIEVVGHTDGQEVGSYRWTRSRFA